MGQIHSCVVLDHLRFGILAQQNQFDFVGQSRELAQDRTGNAYGGPHHLRMVQGKGVDAVARPDNEFVARSKVGLFLQADGLQFAAAQALQEHGVRVAHTRRFEDDRPTDFTVRQRELAKLQGFISDADCNYRFRVVS